MKENAVNSVDLTSEGVNADITGDNKGIFEYRADSPSKKKGQIKKIYQNKKLLKKIENNINNAKNNISVGFKINTQNSYEVFKIKSNKPK